MSLHVARLIPRPLADHFARCLRAIDALFQAGRERIAALPGGGGGDVVRTATTYGRLVRVISLVMLLETRLRALVERAASGATASAAPSAAAPAQACAQPEDRKDEEIEPKLEREREERRERPERVERERFDFEQGGKAFADDRSLSALVAEICRELDFDADATRHAQAPFIALEALLQGEPPPEPTRRHWDRASPGAPFLETSEPSDATRASLEARGPRKPP